MLQKRTKPAPDLERSPKSGKSIISIFGAPLSSPKHVKLDFILSQNLQTLQIVNFPAGWSEESAQNFCNATVSSSIVSTVCDSASYLGTEDFNRCVNDIKVSTIQILLDNLQIETSVSLYLLQITICLIIVIIFLAAESDIK